MRQFRFIVVLALAAVLAACGTAPQAAQPTPQAAAPQPTQEAAQAQPKLGGSVTRALTTEPTGLDPAGPQGSGQNILLPYLFDTLVMQDADNQVQPLLAEKWEVTDGGKSIYFTLRDGLKFHDGTPLDAQAVLFSFERLKDPAMKSPMAANLKGVTKIEAVDAKTVRFEFEQPSATFFTTLAQPYAGIVSPTAVKAAGKEFAQKPVGSGPFKLAAWNPNVSLTLERNPDYNWGSPIVKNRGAPYIDQAIFKVIPDAATQLTALQANEVDVVFLNQPDHITRLSKAENVALLETKLNGLVYLGFNCAKAPFDDARVRQALAHAINKTTIVQTALGGQGTEAFAPMATTLLGFDPSLKQFEQAYDMAKAKALLSEAGFSQDKDGIWTKDGAALTATLLTYTRAPNQDIATVIQSQLKELGVAVEIQQFDAPTASKTAGEGKYDLLLWRYDWNDPDVLSVNLSSSRIGSSNRVFYKNQTVDTLLDQASREMDPQARAKLYVEAQQSIMRDVPWQPLYTPVDMLAINKRVSNVVIGSMGRVLLNDAQVQ